MVSKVTAAVRRKFAAKSKAFTLIELLVTVAIISLLIALLIPNIDRSLDKNQVANDFDLFKAKLEEVRLLSGSTQQFDELSNVQGDDDEVGYYAIYIPSTPSARYFDVVRLAHPINAADRCTPDDVVDQDPECLVERVNLSSNTGLNWLGSTQFIAFRVPTQQLFKIVQSGPAWQVSPPIFDGPIFSLRYLTGNGIQATVEIESYSGRVTAQFSNE